VQFQKIHHGSFNYVFSRGSSDGRGWDAGLLAVVAQIQKPGYYLFAILFLVFDVEIIFLVPWAVVMKKVGVLAFVEALIFILILGLGLLYAWKKKALKWE